MSGTLPSPRLFARAEKHLDNICHTLVGAALAQSGLKRSTPLGSATLLIGANLPDLDGLSYVFARGVDALALRRGWTHGVLAVAGLPVALAGAMMVWDRQVRRRRRPHASPARWRPLLLLAFLSILSHPLLDFLNTYGVRFLMPFSGRWFYGDALFIVDPWLWLLLAVGIAWSKSRERRAARQAGRPAAAALVLAALYIVSMLGTGLLGRRVAAREARASGLAFERLMVGPVPWNAATRMVVFDTGEGYRFGRLRLWPRVSLTLSPDAWKKNAGSPAARAAAGTREGLEFLSWARFPAFSTEPSIGGTLVRLRDARYPGPAGSWARVSVAVPSP